MGNSFFHLPKKRLKRGNLGHLKESRTADGLKWDSLRISYFTITFIDTGNKGNCKQVWAYIAYVYKQFIMFMLGVY